MNSQSIQQQCDRLDSVLVPPFRNSGKGGGDDSGSHDDGGSGAGSQHKKTTSFISPPSRTKAHNKILMEAQAWLKNPLMLGGAAANAVTAAFLGLTKLGKGEGIGGLAQ